MDFTAIDFETAQGYRNSICQVGLVRVEQGRVTTKINKLIQPPNNYYWKQFTNIHGIRPEDTGQSPYFNQIWDDLKPYIENQCVVAHNGLSFDFPVLETTLGFYGLPIPEYTKYCTYRIYGTNLASLCEEYQIPLNHHEALSDALACAQLFLKYQEK